MSAPHYEIKNLTAIVDYNHLQTDGTTEEVMDTGDVRAKFEAFGWDTVEIDGHDMGALVEALERSRTLDRPAAIVCQTKKGRGVSFMEGRFGFHGKPPEPEQAEKAREELDETLKAQTEALNGADPDASRRGEDRADRDAPGLWRRAGRPRRGPRRRHRARRRPRRSRRSRSSSARSSPTASSIAAPPRRT